MGGVVQKPDSDKGGSLASFRKQFSALQENPKDDPFPWQERLFQDLCRGELPWALDLPTGLGKTSVMAIWYLAFKASAPVPRRLVYVVDRRAVVDQATTVAERIKERLDPTLYVSTLRGQHLDNREWLSDPTAATIIVGTIDMVGSRLLFSGYGVSPKMRPYHAGLLGADTLVVLDEAHLVPPFEALLKTVARDPKSEFGPSVEKHGIVVPRFRLMSLSATGREDTGTEGDRTVFRLTTEDLGHPVVKQRLRAEKRLTLNEVNEASALVEKLAERAWALGTEPRPARVLVYCHSRDDGALKVKAAIDARANKNKTAIPPELLVGGRRAREREALFRWLEDHGFVGERKEAQVPTFLIATSAGEVGVDMDADHMLCDLVLCGVLQYVAHRQQAFLWSTEASFLRHIFWHG
jgi:CRISPR-associated endonuclease/helicase Cas3